MIQLDHPRSDRCGGTEDVLVPWSFRTPGLKKARTPVGEVSGARGCDVGGGGSGEKARGGAPGLEESVGSPDWRRRDLNL